MAKSHQLPYPKSSSQSSFPLELIFSDVWGPACDSFGRNKYYVSFIDDYSKFTWIYLLKHKSEVFQCFHDFQNLVERQFDRKILALQSDWGGEYEKLNSFFSKTGIVHLVSCPHAHQQNGAAERKHRHIVEVGLSLLAHSSMPLKYWDQAFLTATYLINRTPSKVINNSTPLERLYKMQVDYDALRTFGCACWPNLRPYNSHKLAFRSKQCVFLGYSNLHKGFKCLDVAAGRVYISRDVVFDESIYPFTQLNPNAGARFRSELLLLPSDLLPPWGVQTHNHMSNILPDDATNHASSFQEENTTNLDENRVAGVFVPPGVSSSGFSADPSVRGAGGSASLPAADNAPGAASPAPNPPSPRLPRLPVVSAERGEAGSSTAAAPSTTLELAPHDSPGSGAAAAPIEEDPAGSDAVVDVVPPEPTQAGPPPEAEAPLRPRTRLQSGIRKEKQFTDGTVRYGLLAANGEPNNVEEALHNDN
jgi:hypothetical protein